MINEEAEKEFCKQSRPRDAYPSILAAKRSMRGYDIWLEITWNGQITIGGDTILLEVGWY